MEDKQFIYFVQSGDEKGPIKIGITNNIENRMNSLQTGCPEQLNLLFSIEGTQGAERSLHECFKHHRMKGEWFKPNRFLLDSIENLKKGWDFFNSCEEKQWQECWGDITEGICFFQKAARKQFNYGNFAMLEYIISELNELIDDIKRGHV